MSQLLEMLRALPPPTTDEMSAAAREPELKLSLLIPARNSGHALESTVTEAHRHFTERFGTTFEIILIPNSIARQATDSSLAVAAELSRKYPQVRVCTHTGFVGKGAALRSGFFEARGEMIFFTDADLPYDLTFFDEAADRISAGCDFVTGNRRLPSSHFNIPVKLLRLAYGRHRLGLAFNSAVKFLIPVGTSDTQAGIKALSRRFAREAFTRQTCPGFFFDLEMFLTQHGGSYSHQELPVTLYLNSEKSTVSLLRELLHSAFWLTRLSLRNLLGKYRIEAAR